MSQRTGLLATILSGVLFGTSIPVIKLGLRSLPPILFVTLRFIAASALILAFLRRQGWVNRKLLRSKLIWTIGAINTFGYVLQFEGQDLTSASHAALIIGAAALMIPIVSRLNRTENLVWRRSLGVVLGFGGTAVVVTSSPTTARGGNPILGDMMILGTAVTIALIFVFSKTAVTERGSSGVTGGILLTTGLLLPLFAPLDVGRPVSFGPEAWFYILFLATFSTVGAYYFFAKGLETVTPTVSSIILPIEVVVSVFLSVLIFQDPFNLFSGTGAVLIILGVLLVSVS